MNFIINIIHYHLLGMIVVHDLVFVAQYAIIKNPVPIGFSKELSYTCTYYSVNDFIQCFIFYIDWKKQRLNGLETCILFLSKNISQSFLNKKKTRLYFECTQLVAEFLTL